MARHSRFVTVHKSSLERALGPRGSSGHRDFSGHGLWGHHISSQAHPPPLPGSPLPFPRALLQSLNKRTWQDGGASQPGKRPELTQNSLGQQHGICGGAMALSFSCFAHSGRPNDRNDSCGSTLMPV